SGSIGASVGYAQDAGLLLGANLQQDNFLGSGKSVGIGVNKSQYMFDVRMNYVNPYYTEDGVSRGFSLFYREADLGEINVANYSRSTKAGLLNFSYPIEETERLTFALGAANTEIDPGYGSPKEVIGSPRPLKGFSTYYVNQLQADGTYAAPESVSAVTDADFLPYQPTGFLDQYGDSYNEFTLTLGWVQSTLNRGQLATRGHSQNFSVELAVPGSDLEYYKLSYNAQKFLPLTESLTLRFRTELGYGDGYGDLDGLPFFQNSYAGGFSSVRGCRSSTLRAPGPPADIYRTGRACVAVDANGACTSFSPTQQSYLKQPGQPFLDFYPIDNADDTAAIGGNVLVEGSVELLFPLPFVKDQRSLRSAVFLDAGNVFSTNCSHGQLICFSPDFNEMRFSAGLGVTWITGFGPLTFSIASPLNKSEFDDTEFFQF